jgi:hypothetical protein
LTDSTFDAYHGRRIEMQARGPFGGCVAMNAKERLCRRRLRIVSTSW